MKNQKLSIKILSISLLLALNLMFVDQIQAQSKDLHIGVQVGMGLTQSNILNGDPSFGCNIYATKNFSELWFAELGLTYNHYDAYVLINMQNFENRYAYIDNYMGISAIGGVQFFKKVKLVIKAGSEVSYAFARKIESENLNTGQTTEESYNGDYKYRFGIIAGAGVIIPISDKLRLNIDIMSNSAIRKTRDDGGKRYRPSSISVFAGIQMAI